MKQNVIIATGETVQVGTGDFVYADLGDGISGGEYSGQVLAIDDTFLTIGDQKLSLNRVIYLDVE